MRALHALFGAIGLISLSAWGFEPFVVKDIRVEGIQRTEPGTVFNYLPIKVGETMDDDKAAAAIKALYATGFFKDVRIESDNGVLVVFLEERPAISQVDVNGSREFDKDTLRKALKQIGLSESRIFDKSLLDKAEQELKRQYLSRGKYGVSIVTTVTPLERNRVAITFDIAEGEVAKIRQVNIVGAQAFKEQDLLGLFVLTTPGWLTWYTKNDQYSKQKLSADLETLRSYYLNRGYAEFTVDSTQVSITPDKRDIYITVNITEGAQYTVSEVKLAGELPVPEDELRKLIKIKPGDIFSRERLAESTKAIADRLGNDGYAFANVNAAPQIDKEKKQVAFTLFVDPSRRVYVRRINVAGNTKTRDEVIRREFRQMEGGWYSGEKIALSRRRVDKLGYFAEVNVETPPVPGSTDQVDVNLNVTEKPTGNILLGAGFSNSEGLILSGSVSQQNVFGSGKHVSVGLNTGKINKTLAFSYTNPYQTIDGISQGFDVYKRNLDPTSLSVAQYKTSTLGGGLRFGVPVSELDTINYGLGAERTSLDVFADSPQRYKDFVTTFGNSNTTLFGTAGWARDARDSLIYPTSGTYQRAFGEVGLPGGTLRYYKLNYTHQRFYPITRTWTLMLNGEVGVAGGYGDKPLPFYKNFFVGGATSVRGFETSSIGPKDSLNAALGGSRRLVGNAELLLPFPGLGNDKSARFSVFVDTGMADDTFAFSSLRYSSGIGVTWISPLGPMKVSLAKPLNSKPDDREQVFQFLLGQVF